MVIHKGDLLKDRSVMNGLQRTCAPYERTVTGKPAVTVYPGNISPREGDEPVLRQHFVRRANLFFELFKHYTAPLTAERT